MIPRFFYPAALFLCAPFFPLAGEEGDPSIQHLFPVPAEVRKILDQSCVLCHGEMIDGRAEIREDLDLSSEAAMRETIFDLDSMLFVIEDDEMPQETKLSTRLRQIPQMQERLDKLKHAYEENGHKQTLLAWLLAKAE